MFEFPILALLLLLGSNLISGTNAAIQRLGKAKAEEIAKKQKGLAKILFKKTRREALSCCLTTSKNLLLICYTLSAIAFVYPLIREDPTTKTLAISGILILGTSALADSLFRFIGLFRPQAFFRGTCQLTTIYLLIIWPLSYLLFKLPKILLPKYGQAPSFRVKERLLEVLHDPEFAPYFDENDQKLLLSLVSFKERIAREVMVPRVDMYTLSSDTPVKEAALSFLEEGYSRIPVWKDSVDNIIGTLYHKDLHALYFNQTNQDELNAPIEKLIKPIVYTPETKKISHLLQEFRSKQIHLAIVVDEYGGTEGIVTIEDILEELVGEIADEFDYDEEPLFFILPSGGWIIDAKMTIIDIAEEIGVEITQSPEYDTIGGYVFHKAGTIPAKGWRLHHDDFDLEILSSSERAIEKIRVTPR
ncbi:MAG: Magnesium and cobalt efflux protein CorC [Chlamydiae bacterium]|nr:Magnesium and cobalt efflux protein CorC [Chlamydiota bacterium]